MGISESQESVHQEYSTVLNIHITIQNSEYTKGKTDETEERNSKSSVVVGVSSFLWIIEQVDSSQ